MAINDYILEIPNLTEYVSSETAATELVTEENKMDDEVYDCLQSKYGLLTRIISKSESSISSTLCSAFNSDAVNDPGSTSLYTGDGFEVWIVEKLSETNTPWNARGDRCAFWPIDPTSCTIKFTDYPDYECTSPVIINETIPFNIKEETGKFIFIVLSRTNDASDYGFTPVSWADLKTMSSNDTLVPPKS